MSELAMIWSQVCVHFTYHFLDSLYPKYLPLFSPRHWVTGWKFYWTLKISISKTLQIKNKDVVERYVKQIKLSNGRRLTKWNHDNGITLKALLPCLYFLRDKGVRAVALWGLGFGVNGATWTKLSVLAGPPASENTGIGDWSLISWNKLKITKTLKWLRETWEAWHE